MEAAQSPLFEPVLWEGGRFKILDELALPERIVYLTIDEVSEAIEAVRSMKTRAFGQVLTFLYSGALIARQHPAESAARLRERIEEMTRAFSGARPTFDFEGLGERFSRWLAEAPGDAKAAFAIEARARELARRIIEARLARSKRAAAELPNPARLLTHCNVSGELVAIAEHCARMGKEFSVIATETRPYLQGSRLTAWELARAGVPVAVIPDGAAAQVLGRGDVTAVVVGSDRCARNGDIINKVGTYQLALAAKERGVPFYALVQDPGDLACGDDVAIEERASAELLTFQGRSLVKDGCGSVGARYPAFDVTPARLLSLMIGFDAAWTPEAFCERHGGDRAPMRARLRERGKYLLVFGVPPNEGYSYLKRALKAERAASILVPEMRPELWGAHVVVPELTKHGLPVTLISDNMIGALFLAGEILKLYLFYDELAPEGPSAICGSGLAALLAQAHGIGVELLQGRTDRPSVPDRNVATLLGRAVLSEGIAIYPVGPETIPWRVLRGDGGGGA